MKMLALIQARMSSKRLSGKILAPILGKPMLLHQIQRVQRARKIEKLIVVTSDHTDDDAVAKLCTENNVACFRGSLDDVLDRFYQAALPLHPEHVVRLTGDCPLTDPTLIDAVIEDHLNSGADYTSNALEPTYPDGLDVEVVRFSALTDAWKNAKLTSEREHVLPFIHGNPTRFKLQSHRNDRDLSKLRWTVDEPADLAFVIKIYEALYVKKPDFDWADILALLDREPVLSGINQRIERNEGLKMSQRKDELAARYRNSMVLLERAQKTIPLGSQTFSKSRTQYPMGVSPFFIKRGQGCRVWDVDNNVYTDFVNSLCAITLGHGDADVTHAVKAQLEDGVIFSLPHPLEMQVAEKIVELVPCAEKVRFGKNGSDATAGAIRLARAFTGRDHVAVCGYHGWQDWYIGSTARNRGVPKATRDLTHAFTYNKIDSLHEIFRQHPDGVAAVILEPMNVTFPEKGYLEAVQELTRKNGALLVFDETITGFRYANGGAQEYFGVTPDLATFGKGMANGYPVSAIAGRADVMQLMEEIFFSFTYGGETLSLAAALATMTKLQKEPVTKTLAARGTKLMDGISALIAKHRAESLLGVGGHPSWSFLLFKEAAKYTSWQLKTLYLQELFARGFLSIGTHNMSYAHTENDVTGLLAAYDEIFPMLVAANEEGSLEKRLYTKPLEPLFKVR